MDRKHVGAMAAMAVSGMVLGAGIVAVSAETMQQTASADRIETPLDVANRLDAVIQQRFISIKDMFGMSRIIKLAGHDSVRFFPQTNEEKRSMGEIRAAGRTYVIGFQRVSRAVASPHNSQPMTGNPGAPFRTRGSNSQLAVLTWTDPSHVGRQDRKASEAADRAMEPVYKSMETIADASLEKLAKGSVVDSEHGEWVLALRPVKASTAECLGCHSGSHKGDTLGVMVYAVKKTISP